MSDQTRPSYPEEQLIFALQTKVAVLTEAMEALVVLAHCDQCKTIAREALGEKP